MARHLSEFGDDNVWPHPYRARSTDNDDFLPDHFRKAADKIPEAYKFTGSVDVSFKLHANELQNVG